MFVIFQDGTHEKIRRGPVNSKLMRRKEKYIIIFLSKQYFPFSFDMSSYTFMQDIFLAEEKKNRNI